jgi:hypothetical protein
MAVLPMLMLMLLNRPAEGCRPIAEAVFAGGLFLSSIYIIINEGFTNWQSVWTCAVYVLLALTMWRARAVRSPE